MKKNLGNVDRVIRLTLASIVAILYVAGEISGTTAIILGVLAGIFVVTSFISFCPLYWPFNISSLPDPEKGASPRVS